MKPRVFISHSKVDKPIIEAIANDLRSTRLDVWYDDWEIPPGDSFRRQIAKGIEECDLFFVYLTPNSAVSYWVQHELDAAFVKQANTGRNVLALFVDSDTTRKSLPIDLQALHSPVLNNTEYSRPFSRLVSRAWESYSERVVQEATSKLRIRQLELENQVKTLELTIARSSSAGNADLDQLQHRLEEKQFSIDRQSVSLRRIFEFVANDLATSASLSYLERTVLKKSGIIEDKSDQRHLRDVSDCEIRDIIGPLVIHGLVHIEPPQGEITDDYYYLTDLGKKFAAKISS